MQEKPFIKTAIQITLCMVFQSIIHDLQPTCSYSLTLSGLRSSGGCSTSSRSNNAQAVSCHFTLYVLNTMALKRGREKKRDGHHRKTLQKLQHELLAAIVMNMVTWFRITVYACLSCTAGLGVTTPVVLFISHSIHCHVLLQALNLHFVEKKETLLDASCALFLPVRHGELLGKSRPLLLFTPSQNHIISASISYFQSSQRSISSLQRR